MPAFAPQVFDPHAAHAEVAELQALRLANPVLKEADLCDFFRSRPNASSHIGHDMPGEPSPVQAVSALARGFRLR
jgi:hypothetical protein